MNLGRENEQTEFKKTTSEMKEAMDSICAILNKHGSGVLYFGVRPDGEVLGQDVEESTLRRVSQAIGNAIAPPIRPTITRKTSDDGRSYVEVRFSGDEAPYSSNGRFRIRVADEDLLMSPAEVRAMALDAEAQSKPWDGRPSERPMSDVEEPVLIDYVTRGNECGRISFSYDGVEDALERLGLLTPDGKADQRRRGPLLQIPNAHAEDGRARLPRQGSTSSMSNRSKGRSSTRPQSGVLRAVEHPQAGRHRGGGHRTKRGARAPDARGSRGNRKRAHARRLPERRGNAGRHLRGLGRDIQLRLVPRRPDPEAHLSGEDKRSKSRNQLIASSLFKSKDIESYGTGMPESSASATPRASRSST